MAAQAPAVEIGIDEATRAGIAHELSRLLADSYLLYLKTHNFHWNVTGPMFQTLHDMFETQYTELATAVDEIAERIRALGFEAPGSFARFAELSRIREETGHPSARLMLGQLVEDQQALIETAREVLRKAEPVHDEPTNQLVTNRMHSHEKNAWMLRSMLE